MNKGVTIIICCYNSSKLLPETIRHISLLEIPAGSSFEVIVVDNNSTDGTSLAAEELFKKYISGRITWKILQQPVQGLSAARQMGFQNSSNEYLIFCDDDNRLSKDYARIVIDTLKNNPNIGALGGESTAVTDAEFPDWFYEFRQNYSVGIQSERNGKISEKNGALWGAGMAVRRAALAGLYSKGFRSLLTDRSKNSLSSGGDIEICYALRLAGWEIWYDSALKLEHFIPAGRLKWEYLRKLNRGFGAQKVNLEPYLKLQETKAADDTDKWHYKAYDLVRKLRGYGFRKLLNMNNSEGDPEILRIEKTIGRLQEHLKIRSKYEERIKTVRDAEWRRSNSIETINS